MKPLRRLGVKDNLLGLAMWSVTGQGVGFVGGGCQGWAMILFLRTTAKAFNWLLSASASGLGLVLFIFPNFRHWIGNHLYVAILIAAIILLLTLAYGFAKSKYAQIPLEVCRDIELIEERLNGWSVQSDIYEYLINHVSHNRFPVKYLDDIADKIYKWRIDTRSISNKKLHKLFTSLYEATYKYNESLHSETWTVGTGIGQMNQFNDFYVQVPPEWEFNDPERYKKAYQTLNRDRELLIEEMQELFNYLHLIKPL